MAKKYRTNINGAPILNVNFNGAPWTGNLKINGVEVSYDDTPAPPPPPPAPQPDTVWKFAVDGVGGPNLVLRSSTARGFIYAQNAPSIFGEEPLDPPDKGIYAGAAALEAEFTIETSGDLLRLKTTPYLAYSDGAPYGYSEWFSLSAKNAAQEAGRGSPYMKKTYLARSPYFSGYDFRGVYQPEVSRFGLVVESYGVNGDGAPPPVALRLTFVVQIAMRALRLSGRLLRYGQVLQMSHVLTMDGYGNISVSPVSTWDFSFIGSSWGDNILEDVYTQKGAFNVAPAFWKRPPGAKWVPFMSNSGRRFRFGGNGDGSKNRPFDVPNRTIVKVSGP